LKLAPSTASILDSANAESVVAITRTEPVSAWPVRAITYSSFTSPVRSDAARVDRGDRLELS
jgi:hypothetical protein